MTTVLLLAFFTLLLVSRMARNVTAKDSFLKNSYLLAMTVTHLKEYDELLNAALTCKDFLEVALDALWEDMNSLLPLLQLLPALKLKDDSYVCANSFFFFDTTRTFKLFRL